MLESANPLFSYGLILSVAVMFGTIKAVIFHKSKR